MPKDYYKILGVSKDANQDEIKRAYRGLAHQYHPDKKGGDEQKFKEVNEAYQVLGDPKKRSQYDQFGPAFENMRGQGGFSGFDDFRDFSGFADAFKNGGFRTSENFSGFEDLGDIFGQFFGGKGRGKNMRKGNDITVDIEITLEEVFFGAKREIEIRKNNKCEKCQGSGGESGAKMKDCDKCGGKGKISHQQRTIFGAFVQETLCDKCNGAGKISEKNCSHCRGAGITQSLEKISVEIPPGVDTGNTLRVNGKGEYAKGGVAGDLYVLIRVKSHRLFSKEGENLYYNLPIKFTQAVIGDSIEIPTIDGKVSLKIPAGIEAGKMIRLKGKGLPSLNHYGKGDMYVRIDIKIPKKLSKNARKLLEELDAELNE
jgi:molecular chaperone DnaJ